MTDVLPCVLFYVVLNMGKETTDDTSLVLCKKLIHVILHMRRIVFKNYYCS